MPSAKNINQVEELTEKLGRAKAVYITEYLGLNVEDITELRRGFYANNVEYNCLLYTSPSPRDRQKSRMPSSA